MSIVPRHTTHHSRLNPYRLNILSVRQGGNEYENVSILTWYPGTVIIHGGERLRPGQVVEIVLASPSG